MPTRTSAVETRQLAPPPFDGDDAGMLYRPVPQIMGDVPMRVSFSLVTPEQAKEWLYRADQDFTFQQRPTSVRDVRRWRVLMDTDRFVEYLPDGPLCFDEQGTLLNGKHRLSALSGCDHPLGFMVIHDVPRWMFRFLDTGRVRSLNDVFKISGRMTKSQTGSSMRLAMRYEEFLYDKRPSTGWQYWPGQRDEHFDVEEFLTRRTDLHDWYMLAQRVYNGSKLIIAAGMSFRFYQGLAWPDGAARLDEFCESLATGANMPPQHPALVLREWSKDIHLSKERIAGKREGHLLLLFRHFRLAMQGDRITKVTFAKGLPMNMPYHPHGSDVAVRNVREALDRMDREAEQFI